MADDGQPQSQASIISCDARVLLSESLKNMRYEIGGNSLSLIYDGQPNRGV